MSENAAYFVSIVHEKMHQPGCKRELAPVCSGRAPETGSTPGPGSLESELEEAVAVAAEEKKEKEEGSSEWRRQRPQVCRRWQRAGRAEGSPEKK